MLILLLKFLVEIYDQDTKSSITETFKLIDYIEDYEGRNSKVLEYYIYCSKKERTWSM